MIIPSDLKKWLKMRIPKCTYSNAILLYIEALEEDAGSKIAEIARLENHIQQLERERDAAVADLAGNRRCENCKHFTPGYFCLGCRRGDQWEWRGVQGVE